MITAQIFCAFYLTGVIWIIQVVHYPAFALIEGGEFADFHRRHSNAMTALVGPVMLVELFTALWLARGFETTWIVNAVSVVIPFGATFALSVPLHTRLERGAEPATCAALVRTNWVRTVAWTARALAFVVYLALTVE